ncbi:hypothetical protein F5141DRAFT_1064338 [Pisolithus sp. B1]|nr:hypothetical protein F5141DRAFT_1064338 [Pisolithus sp. B1]
MATLRMATILSLCREGMQAGGVGMVALCMATIQSPLHMAAILSICGVGTQAGRVGMVALHMATIRSMQGSGALAGSVGMVALHIASILSMQGAVTVLGGVGIITLHMATIQSMLPPPGGMASILGQWVTSALFSKLEVPLSAGETRGDGYNINYLQLGWVKEGIFISHLDGWGINQYGGYTVVYYVQPLCAQTAIYDIWMGSTTRHEAWESCLALVRWVVVLALGYKMVPGSCDLVQ